LKQAAANTGQDSAEDLSIKKNTFEQAALFPRRSAASGSQFGTSPVGVNGPSRPCSPVKKKKHEL
jgi:hypothetical protein